MDIKRIFLWTIFLFSILWLWDSWMRYNKWPAMFFVAKNQHKKFLINQNSAKNINSSTSPQILQTAPDTKAIEDSRILNNIDGQTVTVVTDVMKVEINTIGGELRKLELLNYRDTMNSFKNFILFNLSHESTYLAQSGLIGQNFPNHHSIFKIINGAPFRDKNSNILLVLQAEKNGIQLTKTYSFKYGDYVIGLEHIITNNSNTVITPSLYLQLLRDGNKPDGESYFYSTFTGPAIYTSTNHFQKIAFEKINDIQPQHVIQTSSGWVALIQHYFVSALIPPENVQRRIFTTKIATNLYAIGNIFPFNKIDPGASANIKVRLYSGPQESTFLEKTAKGLDLVKDYGWLTIIAKPIFWLMIHIYMLVGNWGWTIIFLTLFIKFLFFPLSAASYRSMAKMKSIAPKITIIRENYKHDASNMNKEMIKLYKTEKINPVGGCLPILIQIPVFISLYWVLLASVEMRNAPWFGWIHDLASPDPLYILPIIMAISMYVQAKLNPLPPDPLQAKIMLFMPIVFSVMFFFFPAGLVLYWVVNNILSIAQQWFITKRIG